MRRPLLIFALTLLSLSVTGQDVKDDFYDGEFFLAEEEYAEALYAFNKVYQRGYEDNANLNYRIGMCLLKIPGRKTEAVPYLEQAVKEINERYREGSFREEQAPPEAILLLGDAYRISMELEKAREKYEEYSRYLGSRDEIQKAYTEKQIESVENALVAINNPVDYTIGHLGQLIETQANTYNYVISHDRTTVAYMGKNPFYNSVQVAFKKEDGTWDRPLNITPSIVSDGNMEVVSLSPDGKTMLLAVIDEFDSNIYTSEYADNRWYPAESVGRPVNTRYFESHACFSPDMMSIYFASNRDESMGGMDIFRSDLLPDGTYSDPVNLGTNVNTVLNEESPFISPNGKRLYFSSQGHSTIGGFDVFYCDLQEDGQWGEPVNMGYPLNTTDDELAFSPTGITEEGAAIVYARCNRDDYQLFKFDFIASDATPVPLTMEGEEAEEVIEEEVEEIAEEVVEEMVAEEEVEEMVAEEVEERVGEETGETEEEEPAATEPAATEPAVTEPAVTEPAATEPAATEPPERYLLRPVFFDFDQSELSATAKNKLDEVAGIMKSFPSLELEVTGHTDAIGTYEYNKQLSLRRARAVVRYLTSKGIPADRLKATAMSEDEHVARNRTRDNRDAPEGRALNRRAQFNVSITEDVIIEMEEIKVPDHLKLDD